MRENYEPCGLSVTSERTLLVTARISDERGCETGESRVVEYTSDGHVIRDIKLDRSIEYAWQTVQLSSDRLVVCHGLGSSLHRVCLINGEGQIIKSYGGEAGGGKGQLWGPYSLTTDNNSKLVFVADCDNHRVVMLDFDLTHLGQVHSPRDLKFPSRLYFDSSTDRLFVGEEHSRRVIRI